MINLQQIIELLRATKSADEQYSARCPAHGDTNPSLSIGKGQDGKVLLHCHAGCPFEKIQNAIHKKVLEQGLTLPQYAAMKMLPLDYLRAEWRLEDVTWQGRPALALPYIEDAAGGGIRRKIRLSKDSHDMCWDEGEGTIPYGLWRLGGDLDMLAITEGESDAHTLAFHDVPVLGISGAKGWKPEFAEYQQVKNAKKILLVPDRDNAGNEFVRKVALDIPNENLVVVPLPTKDVSELHMEHPTDFDLEWQCALSLAKAPNDYLAGQENEASGKPECRPFTDLGNAERFVREHGEDVRYCAEIRKWFIWNGRLWERDSSGEIYRRAKKTVREMLVEAAHMDSEEIRKALVKHERRSESENRIKAMVNVAQSESGIPIRLTDFDADPMLFNVKNGTIDLRKGELREHRREDLISKISPVIYNPLASAPLWDSFIRRITNGSEGLVEYLARTIGYSLTGETTEHALFLLYGTGANGKSTFLEALRYVMGDYAMTADFGAFLISKGQGIRNDIARLKGARFVTATESEAGKRMAESLVKQLTGGDQVSARFLYGEFFEFQPMFKLFLGTNHRPKIIGSDEGIWRRIRLIPFTVTIPPSERDKKLTAKLKSEAQGILNWAIDGLRDWLDGGLRDPAEVLAATREYRQREDAIAHFLEYCCTLQTEARAGSEALYRQYCNWAETNNEYLLNSRDFSKTLEEKGFVKKHTAQGTTWYGIEVNVDRSVPAPSQGDNLPF
jgi:putative DNA primase/helicase